MSRVKNSVLRYRTGKGTQGHEYSQKKVGSEWENVDIENTLEALQREVCGYIETVGITTDACIIVNEEGLINDMPFNTRLFGLQLFGTILIVGVDGDEFCDLPAPDLWLKSVKERA